MATNLTRQQREALFTVYMRTVKEIPPARTYLQFRRTAEYSHLMDCLMVPFCGMWLGIERDGYTHS
jgi:hypothetical protein